MDDTIVQEFVNLKLSGDYSSEELIRLLSQTYPAQIKIFELFTGKDSSFLSFSTMVKLGSDNNFVQNDSTQSSATSKACSDACHWLMEAGQKYFPQQMNNKLSIDYSQSDNIKNCSRANNDDLSISINNEPRLSPCDLKWIQLINNFNSLYDPKNSSISTIDAIISKDPVSFEITTKFDSSRAIYLTMVKNENLGTFIGEDKSQALSKSAALSSLFEELRKISDLFSSFKSVYPSGIDCCLSQMDLFLTMNRQSITVHVYPKSGLLYQASITLSKLKHFNVVANNQEEARSDAYIQMTEYMHLYCERIKQTNFVANYDRFSSQPYSKRGGAFPGNPGPKVTEQPSSMANKWMDLIANFNKIYDSHLAAEITMDKLMDMDKSVFKKERIKSRDRNGDRQYETMIKFSSATFNGVAASKAHSNVKAMTAFHKRLLSLSEMFAYFRAEYYPKIAVYDFKHQIVSRHGEVLKLKTRERGIGFETIISLVHFCDFKAESKNAQDAEEIAFNTFVDYVIVLIGRLSKTKQELIQLEKEQKQIAILNQNSEENTLKNSLEFSFDDLNSSKGARHSNQAVTRPSQKPVSNSKVDDDKLSKLAKLVNNYNKGITLGTSPQDAIQKLNEMSPPMNSFVKRETTEIYSYLFITTVEFIGIGWFFSSEDSQQKSEHEASSKALDFVEDLNSLIIKFEKAYKAHLYSPLKIMDNLKNNIIKWNTTTVDRDDDESICSARYHSNLQLANICYFDRIAETEMDAKKAVAAEGVDFLLKLAQTIHSN